jgi:G3E family GTPase
MFGKRSYLTESARHRATKASKSHKRSIREAANSSSQHQHHHHHHRRHVSKVQSRPASYRVDTSPR